MKALKTQITINAPAEKVWAVLTDFASYTEWNPFITNIIGEAKAGTTLTNTMEPEGMSPQVFKPKVLAAEPNKEFRWKGKLFIPGLFDGEHQFVLEPTPDGQTILHQNEYFSGILVGLVWSSIGDKTEAGFVAMNEALKKRVEG